MFITEIKESDFRKLNLVGYERVKLQNEDRSWKYTYVEKNLNSVLDVQISYGAKNKIAIFIVNPPEGDNFDHDLYEKVPFDKYYWNDGNSYNVWCEINKIYSKKNYWFIDSNAEFGRLSKKNIDAIYVIHLGE